MLSWLSSVGLKFLASKSVTIILLIAIIGLMVYIWFQSGNIHDLEADVRNKNNIISEQKDIISKYKSRIKFYKSHIDELETTINEYSERTEELNEKYNQAVSKLKDVKLVNTVLKKKYNSLNKEDVGDEEKANSLLDKYIYSE